MNTQSAEEKSLRGTLAIRARWGQTAEVERLKRELAALKARKLMDEAHRLLAENTPS
jgi:hypothetical protein